jgi:hypothetical protein
MIYLHFALASLERFFAISLISVWILRVRYVRHSFGTLSFATAQSSVSTGAHTDRVDQYDQSIMISPPTGIGQELPVAAWVKSPDNGRLDLLDATFSRSSISLEVCALAV